MVMKCKLESNRDCEKWGGEFKAHWKKQPKEGEWKMGYGTYLEMIRNIDKSILNHIPDDLSDILEDVEVDDDDEKLPF